MDIEAVVREICTGCAQKGYRVSEILAAFIARTGGFGWLLEGTTQSTHLGLTIQFSPRLHKYTSHPVLPPPLSSAGEQPA